MNDESEIRLAVASRAAEILRHDECIRQIRLLGSAAHGSADFTSDIDLVIVVKECSTYDEQESYKGRFCDKLKDSDDRLGIGEGRMQLHIGIATVHDIEHPREALDPVLMMSWPRDSIIYADA